MSSIPDWFDWAQRLQTIAQAGLTYDKNPYNIERFRQIQQIAAEILSAGTGTPLDQLDLLLSTERGYATPKLDVRGVVMQEGKMLLVKELADGCWTLPGGWVDVGEPPSQAVEREVWEESGYEVKAVKLLALYDHRQHNFSRYIFHIYKLFFLCELLGGKPATSIETDGAEFFGQEALPPLSLGRVTDEVMQRMFALAAQPDAATEFD